MAVFEVVSGGDRRSLIKRFERKSKQQAISELVDFHLLNCTRIENLEAETLALKGERDRIERNRDMWRGQCERQAEELAARRHRSAGAVKQEPILVEAVAITRVNDEGELHLEWLLEGGIAALELPGTLLLVAHEQITDNEGSGEVYVVAATHAGQVPQAWLDVHAERRRQIEVKGWTSEHDDEHVDGKIAEEAALYLMNGQHAHTWDWCWKHKHPASPTRASRRRQLVIGVALGLAEIERLDRAAAAAAQEGE